MTNGEKKSFLKKYRIIDKNIDSLCEESSVWRSKAEKITQTISDIPKAGSSNNGFTRAVERIEEIEHEINTEIDKLVELKKQIETAINTIDDDILRLLMRYRYINGKTWEQIAVDMHYSYMHITRLHGKALQRMML